MWCTIIRILQRSPTVGGVDDGAQGFTDFFLPTFAFPTSLCQLDQSLCQQHILSLPTFLWTEWLDEWGRKQGNQLEGKLQQLEGEWRGSIYLKSFCSLSSVCIITQCSVHCSHWNRSGGKPYLLGVVGTRQTSSILWCHAFIALYYSIKT